MMRQTHDVDRVVFRQVAAGHYVIVGAATAMLFVELPCDANEEATEDAHRDDGDQFVAADDAAAAAAGQLGCTRIVKHFLM